MSDLIADPSKIEISEAGKAPIQKTEKPLEAYPPASQTMKALLAYNRLGQNGYNASEDSLIGGQDPQNKKIEEATNAQVETYIKEHPIDAMKELHNLELRNEEERLVPKEWMEDLKTDPTYQQYWKVAGNNGRIMAENQEVRDQAAKQQPATAPAQNTQQPAQSTAPEKTQAVAPASPELSRNEQGERMWKHLEPQDQKRVMDEMHKSYDSLKTATPNTGTFEEFANKNRGNFTMDYLEPVQKKQGALMENNDKGIEGPKTDTPDWSKGKGMDAPRVESNGLNTGPKLNYVERGAKDVEAMARNYENVSGNPLTSADGIINKVASGIESGIDKVGSIMGLHPDILNSAKAAVASIAHLGETIQHAAGDQVPSMVASAGKAVEQAGRGGPANS